MKAKIIAGIREVNISDPLCGTWLEFVSFPMTVTNYEIGSPDDPEEITLHTEGELVAWADATFEPEGYEIWDMEIPAGAIVTPRLRHGGFLHSLAGRAARLLASARSSLAPSPECAEPDARATDTRERGEPIAVVALEGGNIHSVETKDGVVVEVSDYDKHSDEPLIVSRYRGTECISQQVLEED